MPSLYAPESAMEAIYKAAAARARMTYLPKKAGPIAHNLIGLAEHISEGRWKAHAHHRLLAEALEKVEKGEIKRLMVEMPPRHGKSELCSVHFPTWYLDRHPDRRVILTSYDADFATTWGRRVRNQIQENPETLTVRLASDSSAASRWNTTRGGGMICAGWQGGITGRGADLFLIDDPVKDYQQANSKTVRDAVWNWWQSTARTRLQPGAGVILIMTRWHQDDLAGRLLQQDKEGVGEGWTRITLPAIAESDNDLLGREIGDALWPEQWPVVELDKIRNTVGSYVWDALFQQRPTSPGGAIFLRSYFTNRYDYDDEKLARSVVGRYISWDTAFTDKEENAWSACTVLDLLPDYRAILRSVYRAHLTYPELARAIESHAIRWNQDDKLKAVIIEDKASGISVLQTLAAEAKPWIGRLLVPFTPKTDKETRAKMASVWCENDSVRLPGPSDNAPWLLDFSEELFEYPRSLFADQVDSFDQAVLYIELLLAAGLQARQRHAS